VTHPHEEVERELIQVMVAMGIVQYKYEFQ